MITITDKGADKVREFLIAQGADAGAAGPAAPTSTGFSIGTKDGVK